MRFEVMDHVQATGMCGHEFAVPKDWIEDELSCPVCGQAFRFAPEQITAIKAQFAEQSDAAPKSSASGIAPFQPGRPRG